MGWLVSAIAIATGLVSTVAPVAQATPPWTQQIPGTYSGEVTGPDYTDPVITELILTVKGDIVGSYAITELAGTEDAALLLGVLTNCHPATEPVLTCTWSDRYGSGKLVLTFDRRLNRFEGMWSAADEIGQYDWTGQREDGALR